MLLKPRTAAFTFLLGRPRPTACRVAPCAVQTGIAAFISSSAFVIVRVLGPTPGEDAVFFAIAASERRR